MTIEFTNWMPKGNEVRRAYRVTRDGAEPIYFQIDCTLSKGSFSTDLFVSFFLQPGPIQSQCSLRLSLGVENEAPELFEAFVERADDGSTLISMFGRDDPYRCSKIFSSGKNMTFQMWSESGELIVRLALPNDDGFRNAYDLALSTAQRGPIDRTPVSGILEQVLRGTSDNDDSEERNRSQKRESDAASPSPKSRFEWKPISTVTDNSGARAHQHGKGEPDATSSPSQSRFQWKPLSEGPGRKDARTLAIVLVPQDENGFGVFLMKLDEGGALNSDNEGFVLGHKPTRDAQLIYAMGLANILKLKVLELART